MTRIPWPAGFVTTPRTWSAISAPAAPANVSRAFCPGRASARPNGVPLVNVPAASRESHARSVPVAPLAGCTMML